MRKKGPQKPPEHTSEHVKSQNFLGVCPQILPQTVWAPLLVFALGPHNPLSGPGMELDWTVKVNTMHTYYGSALNNADFDSMLSHHHQQTPRLGS